MSNSLYAFLMIMVIALVTALLRFIPFFIFNSDRPVPPYITYLGRVLPYSIMAMLVVYCLKNISFQKTPFGLPELVCVTLTALVHIWKRNTLLSIISGTVCYMLFVQFLF